jgi:hypothetical protein
VFFKRCVTVADAVPLPPTLARFVTAPPETFLSFRPFIVQIPTKSPAVSEMVSPGVTE